MLRAKSGIHHPGPQQLDFVDIGLLPALEHEAQKKIDYLLRHVLSIINAGTQTLSVGIFRIVFSLLAAKLLKDRDFAPDIDFCQPKLAMKAVQSHYNISLTDDIGTISSTLLRAISTEIGASFSFRNISVDTLTYVYENTLVSDETRRRFGIHSTPSYLADYVLSQLPIEEIPSDQWHTLDPMCGHGIFLIAAMRRMRNLLPSHWTHHQRHGFFAHHLHGLEIDAFSVEVARMCLMLADFPEPNGWDLQQQDTFSNLSLPSLVKKSMILVGNPSFEDIKDQGIDVPIPAQLLKEVLPNLPVGAFVGMILPRSFIDSSKYRQNRNELLNHFELMSLTALPDDVFSHSDSETVVLAARRREPTVSSIVRYRQVRDQQLSDFRMRHHVTWEDNLPQTYFTEQMQNRIFVPYLRELWENLKDNDRLGSIADIKVGVEYQLNLKQQVRQRIISNTPFPSAQLGIMKTTPGFSQFVAGDICYVSTEPQYRRLKTSSAWNLPWAKPKVILSRARMSRGPWRHVAAIDNKGCVIGCRFFVVWPKQNECSVQTLAAILNSPIAEAYTYAFSFQRDIHKRHYSSIPIPPNLASIREDIDHLVNQYILISQKNTQQANQILLAIDAEILRLYQLPPRLERQLLDSFWGHRRPVPFSFTGYIPPEMKSWIPLHVYISDKFRQTHPDAIMDKIPIIDDNFLKYLEELGRE